MQLALFQPDIPQNVGTLLRLAACMGVKVHIIEPCGFPFDDRRMARAGMDYIHHVKIQKHISWEAFYAHQQEEGRQIILLTTKTDCYYTNHHFSISETLLLGRETAGVSEEVANDCQIKLKIPMQEPMRSLNVAISGAMVLGEALRQVEGFPA